MAFKPPITIYCCAYHLDSFLYTVLFSVWFYSRAIHLLLILIFFSFLYSQFVSVIWGVYRIFKKWIWTIFVLIDWFWFRLEWRWNGMSDLSDRAMTLHDYGPGFFSSGGVLKWFYQSVAISKSSVRQKFQISSNIFYTFHFMKNCWFN